MSQKSPRSSIRRLQHVVPTLVSSTYLALRSPEFRMFIETVGDLQRCSTWVPRIIHSSMTYEQLHVKTKYRTSGYPVLLRIRRNSGISSFCQHISYGSISIRGFLNAKVTGWEHPR